MLLSIDKNNKQKIHRCQNMIKTMYQISCGRIQIVFVVDVLLATISTFSLWSDERGDVCEVDQHQIGDGVDEPLDADGRLERVDVLQVETYNRVVSLLTY